MELFAYLDPGSASALLAAVLAGIAGAGAAIRTYGAKFKNKLMFWKKSEPAADGVNTTASAVPADSTDDKPAEQ
ncbi:MAG TPA: hypothetical protein VMF31_13725 [Solirubrobacterales bacterium]|nr:hypothetical protein [Solirubrobacterales bacterium]